MIGYIFYIYLNMNDESLQSLCTVLCNFSKDRQLEIYKEWLESNNYPYDSIDLEFKCNYNDDIYDVIEWLNDNREILTEIEKTKFNGQF